MILKPPFPAGCGADPWIGSVECEYVPLLGKDFNFLLVEDRDHQRKLVEDIVVGFASFRRYNQFSYACRAS